MNILNAINGHKFNSGILIVVLPVVLGQLGLTHDESMQVIATGTTVVGGIIALIGYVHKIIKGFKQA